MKKNKFATAINCMDGRVQLPVINYLKNNYDIDYVDMITEPGAVRIIAEYKDNNLISAIRKNVMISIEKHDSSLIAVIAHHDCAGNPKQEHEQIDQILKSVKILKSWYSSQSIIGLWVNNSWKVEIIKGINIQEDLNDRM